MQPTYTGLTARSGTPKVGPINTLPWYYENGMSSHGDPALAFGPRPDAAGSFSWDNGSRLYYANLAFPIPGRAPFTGASAVTVSRTDNVAAAAAGDKGAWMDPVIVTPPERSPAQRQGGHLGRQRLVQPLLRERLCLQHSLPKRRWGPPEPIMFSSSRDGGKTWRQRQLTSASSSAQSGGRQGCAVRTDSTGVVYVVWEGTAGGRSVMYLARSFDGGSNFENPRPIANVVDVGVPDPVSGRLVFDGYAGTRTDSFPSLSIANGAPTGAGATDTLVLAWPDARNGLNQKRPWSRSPPPGVSPGRHR